MLGTRSVLVCSGLLALCGVVACDDPQEAALISTNGAVQVANPIELVVQAFNDRVNQRGQSVFAKDANAVNAPTEKSLQEATKAYEAAVRATALVGEAIEQTQASLPAGTKASNAIYFRYTMPQDQKEADLWSTCDKVLAACEASGALPLLDEFANASTLKFPAQRSVVGLAMPEQAKQRRLLWQFLLARMRTQWIETNDVEFLRSLNHVLAVVRLYGLERGAMGLTAAYLVQDQALSIVRRCLTERTCEEHVYDSILDVVRTQTEWQRDPYAWDLDMLSAINGMLFLGGVNGEPAEDQDEVSWVTNLMNSGEQPVIDLDDHPRLMPVVRAVVDRSQDKALALNQALAIKENSLSRSRLTEAVQSLYEEHLKLSVVAREVPSQRYAAGWRRSNLRPVIEGDEFMSLLWSQAHRSVYELDHLRATAAGTITVVMIESHRARTGSYPAALAELPGQVPLDPLTNGEWIYRLLDAKTDSHARPFLLSSRGFDGVDNDDPLQESGQRAWHIDDWAKDRDFVITDGEKLPAPP